MKKKFEKVVYILDEKERNELIKISEKRLPDFIFENRFSNYLLDIEDIFFSAEDLLANNILHRERCLEFARKYEKICEFLKTQELDEECKIFFSDLEYIERLVERKCNEK